MSILIMCSNAACGELLDVSQEDVGKKARCPICGTVQVIGQDLPPKPPAPAAPARPVPPPPVAPTTPPDDVLGAIDGATGAAASTKPPAGPKNPPEKPAQEDAGDESIIDLRPLASALLDDMPAGQAVAAPAKPPAGSRKPLRKPAWEGASGDGIIDLRLLDQLVLGDAPAGQAVATPAKPSADPKKPPEKPAQEDAAGESEADPTPLDQSPLADVTADQAVALETYSDGVLESKAAVWAIFLMGVAGILGGAVAGSFIFRGQPIAGVYIGGALGWVAGFMVAFLFVLSVEHADDRMRCPACGNFFPEGTEFCQLCGATLTGQSINPIARGGLRAGSYGVANKLAVGGMALLGLVGGGTAAGIYQASQRSYLNGGFWVPIGFVGLVLAYLGGYLLEFLLSGVAQTLRTDNKAPSLPSPLSGRNFLAVVGWLAVLCVYVVPLVTLPLLPLALLYLSTAGLGKALNVKLAMRTALRHPGDFTVLWLVVFLWVAGLLLSLALAAAAFVCVDGIPSLRGAADPASMNSARTAMWILVTAVKSAIVSTIICVFGLAIARCIGLFGRRILGAPY